LTANPAITGVGQVAKKDEASIIHPIELLERAARLAMEDAGVRAARIGAVLCTPLSALADDDASLLLGARLDIPPGIRLVSSYSGAAPQQLLAEACRLIQEEEVEAVLVAGGIADASVRRARDRGIDPPAAPTAAWSQGSDGLQSALAIDRQASLPFTPERAAGAGLPSSYFALIQSSVAAGLDPATQRKQLGSLLAPFTAVAASRPQVAWFPMFRTADEISDVTAANRLIAEPFTKLMCSFPTVDLAAAIVVTADPVGSPSSPGMSAPIRPLALTSTREASSPAGWKVMHEPRALRRAVDRVVELSDDAFERVVAFDLYSCFPAAVAMGCWALGLPDQPDQALTVTGGLPYFGGPGASYSLHAIVSMVEDLRRQPDSTGVVVSLGGMADNFSVGIYGAGDVPYSGEVVAPDPAPSVPARRTAEGKGVVDAMTVLHDRDRGPVAAPIIARLPDGSRVGARAASDQLAADLAGTSLVGQDVVLRNEDGKVSYEPAP
jgi:acetyl-CoA C-acetyltransferase